ncbi:uncharacterized protein KY384_007328 [Bacidia gigantensis]|uniref:uncharacterized protein n=1 Tax=Bacidia gigantensis TaxID=2732470 RepID=UPI001D0378CA|nr:uncharacterized protein KY384_007328 [Bacidia gigantensis]KAG8528410.1 hypothetical protein KY384_007328 [Bacidia gigantensis]
MLRPRLTGVPQKDLTVSVITITIPKVVWQTKLRTASLYDNVSKHCAACCCDDFFTADLVYQCLITAPFNQTIALQFLQYYEDTLQLQTTQAYLKQPPSDYQQPSFDLYGGLDKIRDQVNQGGFKNEYDFEYAVQQLVLQTHDAHLLLAYGIMSIFSFGSPYGIVSVSTNGIELPKIFITDDLLEAQNDDADWEASPITTINDQDAVAYLEDFATHNVQGYIEPNADFNNLITTPANDIQGILSTFEGSSIFYPGVNITFKFENGTVVDSDPWLATWGPFTDPSDAPNIITGQQLFDWFILGIDNTEVPDDTPTSSVAADATATDAPTSSSSAAADSSDSSDADSSDDSSDGSSDDSEDDSIFDGDSNLLTSWNNIAYPIDPIASQANLGDNGGVLTGYVLNDNITAVLSIPSFAMTVENAFSFSQTVQDTITRTKAAGCTRIIVDLQGNIGGSDLLATDVFKQFFPTIDPFGGARARAEKTGDALGNTFTTFYETHQFTDADSPTYEELSASEWVATSYLSASTGQNFTSWGDYFGPVPDHDDFFTQVQRNNLSSTVFTEQVAGIVIAGFANRTASPPQPFPSKDVILLTDSLCSSACARFVEMMRTEGGARTVVAGGRPDTSRMQAVGGNKGAESYSSFDLDIDIATAIDTFNASVAGDLPSSRSDAVDFVLLYAGFNIKDGMRKGQNTPLQFTYEPADCRIFYTTWTFYNYINLWNYVIDALYRNPSLCVANTIGPNPSNPTTPSVGSAIMKGLSAPPAPSPSPSSPSKLKPKRSTTNSRIFGRNQKFKKRSHQQRKRQTSLPSISTQHFDRPAAIDQCQSCKRGESCFPVPFCQEGALKSIPKCVRTCNQKASIGCPGGDVCYTKDPARGGQGVCLTGDQSQAQRRCGAGKGGSSGIGKGGVRRVRIWPPPG